MNWMQRNVILWLVPSTWIDELKGNKRILGGVMLLLWVLIYGMPAAKPEWQYLAEYGRILQLMLESAGVEMQSELLVAGVGMSVVGLIDWVSKHFTSDAASAGLKKVYL